MLPENELRAEHTFATQMLSAIAGVSRKRAHCKLISVQRKGITKAETCAASQRVAGVSAASQPPRLGVKEPRCVLSTFR